MDQPKYIRPLNNAEIYCEMTSHQGLLTVTYVVGLTSKKPLDTEILRKALEILHSKLETLKLCIIKNEEGKMIFVEQTNQKIDFQVHENADTTSLVEKLVAASFNTEEGPLWRIAIVTPSSQEADQQQTFNYSLIFNIHHSICDGFSNLHTLDILFKIWNGLISGNSSISDTRSGKLITTEWMETIMMEAKQNLKTDDKLKKKFTDRLTHLKQNITQMQKLPPYDESVPNDTHFCIVTLDAKKNERLKKLFKSHKVSFHSGLCALLDWTIFQTLQKFGKKTSPAVIQSGHVINARRFDEDNKDNFGMHIQTAFMQNTLSPDTNIWNYASKVAETLNHMMEHQYPNYDFGLIEMESDGDQMFESHFPINPEDAIYDYSISNMGDATQIFSGDGEHVQAETLTRYAKLHTFGELFALFVHTFKGKLFLNFAIILKFFQPQAAQNFIDDLLKNIDHLLEEESVQ